MPKAYLYPTTGQLPAELLTVVVDNWLLVPCTALDTLLLAPSDCIFVVSDTVDTHTLQTLQEAAAQHSNPPFLLTTQPVPPEWEAQVYALGVPRIFILPIQTSQLQQQLQWDAKQRAAIRHAQGVALQRISQQLSHVFNNATTELSTLAQLFPKSRDNPRFLDQVGDSLPRITRGLLRPVRQISLLAKTKQVPAEVVELPTVLQHAWREAQKVTAITYAANLNIGECPERVLCPQDALQALFVEWFINALQASQHTVTVTFLPQGDFLAIIVADGGTGTLPLAPEGGAVESVRGMGMGLALVHKLAKEIGGKVTYTQGPNKTGTQCQLTLPIFKASPPTQHT